MKSFVIFSPDQVQNSNCFDDLIEILMALLEHDKNYVDSDKALKESFSALIRFKTLIVLTI